MFSCFYYIWHQYFGLSLEDLHAKVFKRLLYGISMPLLKQHAEEFVGFHLERLLYFPAWEKLKRAQHEGHFTCILSNSPSFLVRVIAERFQVDAWEASEYLVDKDQRLCQIQKILQGVEKACYVEEITKRLGINKEKSTGYSDSYLDLPFLYSVGNAVVVNPDRKLKRVADRLKWKEI